MNSSNVMLVMSKLEKQIPKDYRRIFCGKVAKTTDDCVNELLYAPIKKKGTTLALSILLGGIGVDRFYLGDKGLGVAKIIMRVVTLLCSSVVGLGIVLSIASTLWCIIDIFLTYKKAKEINYDILVSIVRRNQEKEDSDPKSDSRSVSGVGKRQQVRAAIRNFASRYERKSECENTDNGVVFSMAKEIRGRVGLLGIIVDIQETQLAVTYTFGRVRDEDAVKTEKMAEAYNACHNNGNFSIQLTKSDGQFDGQIMLMGLWNYAGNVSFGAFLDDKIGAILREAKDEELRCFIDITYPDVHDTDSIDADEYSIEKNKIKKFVNKFNLNGLYEDTDKGERFITSIKLDDRNIDLSILIQPNIGLISMNYHIGKIVVQEEAQSGIDKFNSRYEMINNGLYMSARLSKEQNDDKPIIEIMDCKEYRLGTEIDDILFELFGKIIQIPDIEIAEFCRVTKPLGGDNE